MILQSNHVSDTHRMSHSFSSVNVWISASLLTLLLTVFILLAFSNVTFRIFFFKVFFVLELLFFFLGGAVSVFTFSWLRIDD